MDKEKCSKRVNGECGHKIECLWCPAIRERNKDHEDDDDDADCLFD